MAERIRGMARVADMVGEVRQVGLLLAVELRTDFANAEKILYRCLELGLSFKLSAGTTILLQPPLNLTKAEEDFAMDVLGRALVP
jgi:4-aminobutyrate aminotransferase